MTLAFCDDQLRHQMTLASDAERPLEGGRYEDLKQYSLERYFRDSRSGTVMESHLALHDMMALPALWIARWREDA